MQRNAPGTPRNGNGFRRAVQPIREHHNITCLSRRRCAMRAHGNADISGGQHRRVIDAIAHHGNRPIGGLGPERDQLSFRVAVRQHGIQAKRSGDGRGGGGAITGHHQNARNAKLAQRTHGVGRFFAQPIRHDESRCRAPFHRQPADRTGGTHQGRREKPIFRAHALADQEALTAQRQRLALHQAGKPAAWGFLNAFGHGQIKAARAGSGDQGDGNRVGGSLRQGGPEAERRIAAKRGVCFDPCKLWPAWRQRARFIENHGADAGQPFERRTALHHNAAPRRATNAGDQRNGGGEDKRAGGGHHQHRQGAAWVAGNQPGRACQAAGQDDEGNGPLIGKPHQRRAGL